MGFDHETIAQTKSNEQKAETNHIRDCNNLHSSLRLAAMTATTTDRNLEIISLPRNPANSLRFLKVSYAIYGKDPNWVAPLLSDMKLVFADKNPLFQEAEMALWIARRNGRDVGRIAGILDRRASKDANDKMAFFGFFECVDDAAISRALFKAVFDWARQKGAKRIQGPMNPTTNDECGLLVDRFDSPPVFMMTYNPRYYLPLIESEGLVKTKDLLAYRIDLSTLPMERLTRIAEKVRARNPNLTFRPVRRKTLEQDLGKVNEVYNAAWQANWGFVAMSQAELDFMAARLKPLFAEGLVWLEEAVEKPVGFLLAMPDYNVAIQPLGGRLMTPKLLGFVPYLLGWKCPPRARVLTLGVVEGYRGRGLEAVMLIEGLKVGFGLGFTEAEASWILEDNVMMCRLLETVQGKVYKTYRIYEKAI